MSWNFFIVFFSSLCSKKSNEYIIDITNELLDIIYKYDNINAVNKIKKRMIYNISNSGISDIKKNKILNKIWFENLFSLINYFYSILKIEEILSLFLLFLKY